MNFITICSTILTFMSTFNTGHVQTICNQHQSEAGDVLDQSCYYFGHTLFIPCYNIIRYVYGFVHVMVYDSCTILNI